MSSAIDFKNLNLPKKLKIGETIGVVAPSAGNANFFPHRIENSQNYLEKMGYKVKYAKHARENRDYVSSDEKNRVEDIHEMFADPSVSAVICTIGGNHSNQLLKYLDFDLIRKNPKIFLGYSDISVLHYAFLKEANLQTFYGPCLMTQFGEYPEPLEYTINSFKVALTQNEKNIGAIEASKTWTSEILDWRTKDDMKRPRKLLESSGYKWLRPGSAEGRIIGGCIPSINHLAGTKYWVEPENCIFFIDIPEGHEFGVGLSISELDAYLADLDNMGVFQKIAGLIVGRPYRYTDEKNEQLKELIKNYTAAYSYPILMDVNIGHSDPIITLPIGANVKLNSENNTFSIESKAVI